MLLDTSGLYAYLDATDAQHRRARSLLDAAARRVTHGYVLGELVALCNARRFHRVRALDLVAALQDDPTVEIAWTGPAEQKAAIALLRARLDKSYSLCDALSFLLMRERSITDALTTDHHFEQEGFIRLLKP